MGQSSLSAEVKRFWPRTLLRNKDPLGRSILPVASLGDGGEAERCRGIKKHKSLYLWSGEGVSQQALIQHPNTGASASTTGWFSTPPALIPSRTLHKVTAILKTQPVSNPPFKLSLLPPASVTSVTSPLGQFPVAHFNFHL